MQTDVTDTRHGAVTRLLHAARGGDRDAVNRIVPLVYEDLRAIASRKLRREGGERTMHPTSLVHETYMKLSNGAVVRAGDRAHLLAIAARAMRQVLVDDARRRSAAKRGGEWDRAPLEDHLGVASAAPTRYSPSTTHSTRSSRASGRSSSAASSAGWKKRRSPNRSASRRAPFVAIG